MKLNCWEFKGCGREYSSGWSGELGVCPATVASTLNGVHGGSNAGRVCWVVAGTFCDCLIQGTFARGIDSCVQCDFFQLVRDEERIQVQIA